MIDRGEEREDEDDEEGDDGAGTAVARTIDEKDEEEQEVDTEPVEEAEEQDEIAGAAAKGKGKMSLDERLAKLKDLRIRMVSLSFCVFRPIHSPWYPACFTNRMFTASGPAITVPLLLSH